MPKTTRNDAACVDVVEWTANGFSNTCVAMSREQSIGLAFAVEAGMTSLVGIVILVILVVRNSLRYKRKYPTQRLRIIQRPIDIYMIALFLLDLIQAVGMVLDIKWVNEGKTFVDGYCTAQGGVEQFGEAGSAIMTLVITLHTAFTVCRFIPAWNWSLPVACSVVGLVYLFLTLWVSLGIGLHAGYQDDYMTPTPYWCWIGSKYMGQRIAGEYLWLWLTLVSSILVYVPLFLWKHGNLSFIDGHWWQPSLHWTPPETAQVISQRKTSLSFLAYPVAYAFLVLPLSIIRWVTFGDSYTPSAWTFFAIILFGLTGTANVLLLVYTRPGVLLFTQTEDQIITANTNRTDANGGRAPSVKIGSSTDLSIAENPDIGLTEPTAGFDDFEMGSV